MRLGRSVSAIAGSVFAPEAGHKDRNYPAEFYSKFLVVLLTFLMFGPSMSKVVFGQVETGSISGTVKDATGGVIPDAKVTAKSVERATERTVNAGPDGVFVITGLNPGFYDVTVNSGNFAPFVGRVEVTVSGQVTLDVQLAVSSTSTTVEVIGEGGTTVNTQNQEVSQVISSDQIAQMPSLTRNPYDFVSLSGNVSSGDSGMASGNSQTSGAGQNTTTRGVGFSLNGQRPSGTELLLDGAENINVFDTSVALEISQDTVQEFRVITNNFDAQYGRASGGVINLTSKTGTNSLHGSAWEFNRLSAYTANTFDNDANDVPKGTYTRNQFGYTVGGPVVKDKLFFFQSTEWLRVRSSAVLLNYIPTPQFLAASAANTQAFFTAFGKGAPTSFVSTVTQAQIEAKTGVTTGPFAGNPLLTPNTPVLGLVSFNAPTDAGGDNPQNTYNVLGRVDYNFTPNTTVFFRYGRESLVEEPGSAFASAYPQYNVGESIKNNNYLLSVSHIFSPSLLSSTKLSFFRDIEAQTYNATLQNTPTLFLFNGATFGGTSIGLPGFYDNFTGTGGLPYGGPQNSTQIQEDLVWSKAKHTIRFGGQYNYIQMNKAYGAYAQANEQIGSSLATGMDNFVTGTLANFTAAVSPQGKVPCAATGYTAGGSRVGIVQTAGCTVTLPVGPPSFARSDRYNDWALYMEDSFRVTPRLTLNYGLRYEHYGVQHNDNQALDSNLYYGPGSNVFEQERTATIQLAKSSSIGQLWAPRWGTAAPRVGFAYDIFGNGSTSFRGGYGISYERNFGNVTFNMIQNPPNYATVSQSGTPITNSDAGPLAGTGAPVGLPPVSPRQVAPNINVAQTQFWGATLERQLGHKSLISIGYNGAHGVHLYDISNLNELGGGQAYFGDSRTIPGVSCSPTCWTRPNMEFTSINNRGSNGFSHYNALNIQFQSQEIMHTGVSMISNYTWAHSLDNLSSTFSENSTGANGIGNLGYLDPRNPALDYGNSDFDIRNRLVLSPIWNTPWFKGGKSWERQVLGGYTLVGIFTARSGTPYSVMDSSNSLNGSTQGPYGIPRYVPTGTIPSKSPNELTLLSPNDYGILSLPAANHFTGMDGISDFGPYPANMTDRNQFEGPGAWTFDFSLAKSFAITERVSLEFRAEAFNIFNHHNLYVNGFDLDAANFPTGAVTVDGKFGGLGAAANNGNHDERRFGQFALRLIF
jgi:Carboxypeptidase regulatory-like domain/TonB dependent receptor